MDEIIKAVESKAQELNNLSMLAHTHGQPATPTTVGKELAVFAYRWNYIKNKIMSIKLKSKFNGATGNFAAHSVCIDIDWIEFAKEFVESFKLEYNPLVTQIESHDTICEVMSYIKLFNNITMDFNQDMWTYISMKYFYFLCPKTLFFELLYACACVCHFLFVSLHDLCIHASFNNA